MSEGNWDCGTIAKLFVCFFFIVKGAVSRKSVASIQVVSIQSRFDTRRFDRNSTSEIAQKCCSLQV